MPSPREPEGPQGLGDGDSLTFGLACQEAGAPLAPIDGRAGMVGPRAPVACGVLCTRQLLTPASAAGRSGVVLTASLPGSRSS
jgi:hypothetical protein